MMSFRGDGEASCPSGICRKLLPTSSSSGVSEFVHSGLRSKYFSSLWSFLEQHCSSFTWGHLQVLTVALDWGLLSDCVSVPQYCWLAVASADGGGCVVAGGGGGGGGGGVWGAMQWQRSCALGSLVPRQLRHPSRAMARTAAAAVAKVRPGFKFSSCRARLPRGSGGRGPPPVCYWLRDPSDRSQCALPQFTVNLDWPKVERERERETEWGQLKLKETETARQSGGNWKWWSLVVRRTWLSARCLRDLRSVSASLVLTDPQVGESHQQRHRDMNVIEIGREHLLLVVTIYINTEQCLGLHR